ncbi:hypothetical protein [Escherichia coli]|nr:hypothetical protein [Escherichia coli]
MSDSRGLHAQFFTLICDLLAERFGFGVMVWLLVKEQFVLFTELIQFTII